MGGEEVIELSVEETNKLRAELGLAPLRLDNDNNKNGDGDKQQHQQEAEEMTSHNGDNRSGKEGGEEMLEMSIDDTNQLRAKLGLKPLRTDDSKSSKKEDKIIHKPAVNDEKINETKQKLEHEKLKRDVDRGVVKTFGSSTLADTANDNADDNDNDNDNTLSWAERMRKQQGLGGDNDAKKKKKSKKKGSSSKKKDVSRSSGGNSENGDGGGAYSSNELEGIHVAHNLTELQSGSTTVLTLADAQILDTTGGSGSVGEVGLNENDVALENVNLQEQKKTKDGLRKKRLLELGMGRAGGYSGFDDEEFEELGGTLGPARKERGGNPDYEDDDEGGPKSKGFTIGSSETTAAHQQMSDFDKVSTGKAISLKPTKADVVASDYMTIEEEQQEAEERAKKKKKKDGKFKKSKKKKDKKKKRRGRTVMADSDNDEEEEGTNAGNSGVVHIANEQKNAKNLLEQLEKTAGNKEDSSGTSLRKRRRSESEGEEDGGGGDDGKTIVKQEDGSHQEQQEGPKQKRSRYEEIMQKGNERTKLAFQDSKPKEASTNSDIDEEPDDSFLNAALEKARRLNRLRELNQKRKKGAEVVADAVQSIVKQEEQQQQSNQNEASSGTLTFAIDDTREFTRALRARSQQNERKLQQTAKQQNDGESASSETKIKEEEQERKPDDSSSTDVKVEDVPVNGDDEEDVDMEELAKEVKIDDDDAPGFGDATASATGVGRGLSSFVSMLKQTGEINAKRGNKEELRGRAKDERNYENYKAMDLSKVVKIGRNATDVDREFAEREVKLEYRDKHGRLLTQKEAYRELCYQFHGHGGSKKKEEKRLKQIERERAEGRLASRQVVAARDGTAAGTLGALKATQKATGKAFIVHKT